MREYVNKLWEQVKNFFTGMTKQDRWRLAILTLAIIVLSVVLAVFLNRTNYVTLANNLTESEAGSIIAQLKDMGVAYKTEGKTTVLVPEEQYSELYMELSAGGYFGDTIDTSLLDKSTGFNISDTLSKEYINAQNTLWLQTQIKALDPIESCLVTIIPQSESSYAISGATTPASVSIIVKVRGGNKLTQGEVDAIGALAVASVKGLEPSNVKIVDQKMKSYTVSLEDSSGGAGVTTLDYQFEYTQKFRQAIEEQLENYILPLVGANHYEIFVFPVLSWDDITTEEIEFAPPIAGEEEGMLRSSSELYEATRDLAEAEGNPGTDTNGMGTIEYPEGVLTDEDYYQHVLIEKNYELNQTINQIKRAKGTLTSLNISVSLDSNTVTDISAELQEALAVGLGINANRISIMYAPFVELGSDTDDLFNANEAAIRTQQIRQIIMLVIRALTVVALGICVLLLVRSLIGAYMNRPSVVMADGTGMNIDYVAEDTEPEVEFDTKPENLTQLEVFIEKDPQAVAQLLRNWITDD